MDKDVFDSLVSIIKSDVGVLVDSSGQKILENPAFLMIVDAGRQVIPFIVDDYINSRDVIGIGVWPLALEMITGEAPYRERSRGKCYEIRKDWLKWLKRNSKLLSLPG